MKYLICIIVAVFLSLFTLSIAEEKSVGYKYSDYLKRHVDSDGVLKTDSTEIKKLEGERHLYFILFFSCFLLFLSPAWASFVGVSVISSRHEGLFYKDIFIFLVAQFFMLFIVPWAMVYGIYGGDHYFIKWVFYANFALVLLCFISVQINMLMYSYFSNGGSFIKTLIGWICRNFTWPISLTVGVIQEYIYDGYCESLIFINPNAPTPPEEILTSFQGIRKTFG